MATRKPSASATPEAPPPAPAPEAAIAPEAPDSTTTGAEAPEAAISPEVQPAPEPPKPYDAVADALSQHREVVMQIRNHPLGIDARQISFALNTPIQQIHQAINALEAAGLIRKANLVGFQVVTMTPIGALETGKL